MAEIKITNNIFWIWRAQTNSAIDTHMNGGVRTALMLSQLLVGSIAEVDDDIFTIKSNAFDVYIVSEKKEKLKELKWLMQQLGVGYYPKIQLREERQLRILGRLINGIMQGIGADHIAKKIIQDLKNKNTSVWPQITSYIKENSTSSAVYVDFRIKWLD